MNCLFIARHLCLTSITLLLSGSALAQEARVRTTLNASDDIWVGQRVVLVVELLAPGIFAGAPTFDLPDPPGLLLVPPSETPTLSSEQIDGTSYTVQRHEVSIFPQRAGPVNIPRLMIRFGFKRHPLDQETVAATVTTDPAGFTAKMPAGAEALGPIISSHNLTATESWKPEPGKAKTGAAFSRTVIFAASDIPGMTFPPFPANPIDGIGIYPQPPEVIDHNERGDLGGERRQVFTYVCQRPGKFVIPAARLTWFNLDSHSLVTITFPRQSFEVTSNPALATRSEGDTESTADWRPTFVRLSVWIIIAAFVLWLLWRTRRIWAQVKAAFRPVHLAPLNPEP